MTGASEQDPAPVTRLTHAQNGYQGDDPSTTGPRTAGEVSPVSVRFRTSRPVHGASRLSDGPPRQAEQGLPPTGVCSSLPAGGQERGGKAPFSLTGSEIRRTGARSAAAGPDGQTLGSGSAARPFGDNSPLSFRSDVDRGKARHTGRSARGHAGRRTGRHASFPPRNSPPQVRRLFPRGEFSDFPSLTP